MGAAGLTSSSIEMASKGNLGIQLNLGKVPCREYGMTPYEIMLSESQERMLIVLENGKEAEAKKIFDKWNLDFAVIGKTTDSKKIELFFDNNKVVEIPINILAENAPIYDRKWKKTKLPQKIKFNKDDFKKLKQEGLDDGEILEANQIICYFNYVNRSINGLGVTTKGDIVGYYKK